MTPAVSEGSPTWARPLAMEAVWFSGPDSPATVFDGETAAAGTGCSGIGAAGGAGSVGWMARAAAEGMAVVGAGAPVAGVGATASLTAGTTGAAGGTGRLMCQPGRSS